MKTTRQISALISIPVIFGLFSCDEEMPNVSGMNHIYELKSVSDLNIDGYIKIRERNDGSTQAELVLNNLNSESTYPAYIHFNNALQGGGVVITLTPVDGHSQNSVTEIRTLDSGDAITYEELRTFDGHLNIHLGNTGVMVAQADIGLNALTGRFQQFTLVEGDIEGANGLITIEERESGFSLVTVEVTGTIQNQFHPVTLNFGPIFDNLGRAGTLNPVNGNKGISRTHVETLDGALVANYQSLVDFNGFIAVHLGEGIEMNTVLAQGNIAYIEN
jgi:hypothetical protein